ncbi:MAG TPA: hypothetical protein PKE40_11000 [Arachnia sp.]|nr:hypothetical protein [Arachnia sp.]HMT86870.1 hypothetical protein [Arachnia sp.]
MNILIIGHGPIARVLATSIGVEHRIVLAVRGPAGERNAVASRRVGAWPRPIVERRVERLAIDSIRGRWDAVITTAPPHAPGVRELLTSIDAGAVTAVSQVPSEVAALKELASDRPWGLIVPGVLAWDTQPTRWWRIGSVVSVAGPAAPHLRGIFRHRAPEVALPGVLLQAATTMPVVAGLHAAGFRLARAAKEAARWARAADEARRAIAAEYRLPEPRPVRPLAVRAALWALPRVAPLDVPVYLRSHFGGHRSQTMQMLTDWISAAQEHSLRSGALEELREQLEGTEHGR